MSKFVWSAADFTTPGSDTSPDELPDRVKGTPLADSRVGVTSCFFPDGLNVREWWVNWILDGAHRKRPVAPWKNGHAFPAKWKGSLSVDERPETDVETATRWAEFDLDDAGLSLPDDARSDELGIGLILPNERPKRGECVALIDWDDVVDEDGNIHPVAAYYIIKYGGFVELSQSEKGLHQFVFARLRKRGKFIAPIDDEPFVGDDLPQVEIYDGGRHVAMTGRHVAGTDVDLAPPEQGQAAVDDIITEYAQAEQDAGHRRGAPTDADEKGIVPDVRTVEYSGKTPDEWDVPDDRPFGYYAIVRAFCHGYAGVMNWRLEGAASAYGAADGLDVETVDADLAGALTDGVSNGYDGKTRGRVRADHERARRGEFHPPSFSTLYAWGILPEGFGEETTREHYGVEECEPPLVDRETPDVDAIRARMEERLTEHLGSCKPSIWNDDPGLGKTTTAALAAAKQDVPHAVFFERHDKAREFVTDDVTPEEYFHLKGAAQKREDVCMDADHAGDECPNHGHTSNCPSMCPIKDLGREHSGRALYEALAAETSERKAHQIVHDLLGVGEGTDCPWLAQFSEAANADRIAAVHEYQQLKTLRESKSGKQRVSIVDETPRSLRNDRELTVAELTALLNALDDLAATLGTSEVHAEFVRFGNDLLDFVMDDPNAPDSLAEIESPAIEPTEVVEQKVDPENLPPDVNPDEVTAKTSRKDVGAPEEGYRTEHTHVVRREQLSETLARAKLEYGERTLSRMKNDEWTNEPLAYDALFAAAIEAGMDSAECRRAIAAPSFLDGHCPQCGSHLRAMNGMRVCAGEDGCGWDEDHGHLVDYDGSPARSLAYTKRVSDDDPAVQNPDDARLVHMNAPRPEELPDNPIVLDATATPAKVEAFYGVEQGDARVYGDVSMELPNAHVTQVSDGQYHAGTIDGDDSETLRTRIQSVIDLKAELHDYPLYVVKKGLRKHFEFPEHGEVVHYHANRGMNFADCDAVVCIGAPHPNVEDLKREAELLALDRDGVDVGGEEFSTRRDAPNPPVYRKLDYADDNGRGRAVPTKHYSGLVGELFREGHSKEIEQSAHRARPTTSADPVDVTLLTNVPTDLPIDDVCTFAEIADDITAVLPVSDSAVAFAEIVEEAMAGDVEGFRPGALAKCVGEQADESATFHVDELHRLAQFHDLDVCEDTVRRWVDDLQNIGLLDAGAYVQREGVPYTADISTLTSALSVLHYNDGVEVAVKRRIAALATEGGPGRRWIRYAREVFGLQGDPEARTATDAPPG